MKKRIANYLAAFDELNTLISFSFRESAGKDPEERIRIIIDDLLTFLILAYQEGIQTVSEMLDTEIKVDIQKMNNAIYQKVGGEDFADRVRKYVLADDLEAIRKVAETERHRIHQTAMDDGAESVEESEKVTITKTWLTVGDDKVRDTHAYLDNMETGLHENFYTYDGDFARFPGDFEKAENNVNCRCILLYARQGSR